MNESIEIIIFTMLIHNYETGFKEQKHRKIL